MKDIILFGDCLETLKQFDEKARCCITSPPYYGLRDYGGEDYQIGLEESPEEYIQKLVLVFREVRNNLTEDGTLWLNMGDSYYNYRPGKGQSLVKQTVSATKQDLPDKCARRGNKLEGLKEKDLIGIPWMLAFALRADGWYLRQDIIWNKSNPMPESVRDRCTKSHEYLFLLSKNQNYYFDVDAIKMSLEVYDNIIFANGGDRGNTNTPEYEEFKDDNRVKFMWGVGGSDKKNSSSWILDRWNK